MEFVLLLFLTIKYSSLKKSVTSKEDSDYWCVKAWSNTLDKLNYDSDIVFFGNSLTYYSNFSAYFPETKVVNLGYPGQGLKGMLLRHKQISSVKPEKIFVMAGINDLRLDKMNFPEFKYYYSQLIDSIVVNNPHSKIYIENVLPVNHSIDAKHPQTGHITNANLFISELAKSKGIQYIDLYKAFADDDGELIKKFTDDGIHINSKGYDVWASILEEYIR